MKRLMGYFGISLISAIAPCFDGKFSFWPTEPGVSKLNDLFFFVSSSPQLAASWLSNWYGGFERFLVLVLVFGFWFWFWPR